MSSHMLFIFGLGYSTAAVARQAQEQGWNVTSTARQPVCFAPLMTDAHRIVPFDPAAKQYLDDDSLEALQAARYVITSIPPVAAKLYDPVLAAQHKALRQAVQAGGRPALGYLSSTGVYGDWGGDWVDESSETRTATARGVLRREAEQAWEQLALQQQQPLTLFRLGGIYGPMRSVLTNLQSQAPSSGSAARRSRQRFTSRCHVADVAQAVLADMQRRMQQLQQHEAPDAAPGSSLLSDAACSTALVDIVNVVDDEPAPRTEVEAYARQLLGHAADDSSCSSGAGQGEGSVDSKPASHPEGQQQSKPRRSEPLEEKRVRNTKLKQLLNTQLGGQLLAPTFREGLTMSLEVPAPFHQVDLACLYGLPLPADSADRFSG